MSFLWNSAGNCGNSFLLQLGVLCCCAPTLHFFITGGPLWAPVPLSCLIQCVLSPIACPRGCLRCSHRDRCHLCDHGFLLKSGLCVSNCVPGFPAHSNETCAGKCFPSDALVKSPVISPRGGWVCRYSWLTSYKMQAFHSRKTPGAAME